MKKFLIDSSFKIVEQQNFSIGVVEPISDKVISICNSVLNNIIDMVILKNSNIQNKLNGYVRI